MDIQIATDKIQWNSFLNQNPRDGLFLQSWEWGEILETTGQNVKRLCVVDDGVVVAQAQIVIKQLPLGKFYALCAKGPVVARNQELRIKNQGYELLSEHLKQKNCVFFRIEPSSLILNSKFLIPGVKDINPPATLVLDVTPTEEELLKNMHEKTRYNIRLAQKKELRVTIEKNFDIFWDLLKKTGERDGFVLHSKKSYETIMSSELVQQIIVWSGETPVATAGFVGFSNTMYYLYGASDHAYRQLMGPHLMQWGAIRLAKKFGYRYYDFFGVAPSIKESPQCHAELDSASGQTLKQVQGDNYKYDINHRYAGVTRFKLGFGGVVREEPGTFDVILSLWEYRVYVLLKQFRSLF